MRQSGLGGYEIQSRGKDGGLRMHPLKPDGKRINEAKWAELQAGLKEKLAGPSNTRTN